jgi:peptidyl-prolyl cis-trans isomerase C
MNIYMNSRDGLLAAHSDHEPINRRISNQIAHGKFMGGAPRLLGVLLSAALAAGAVVAAQPAATNTAPAAKGETKAADLFGDTLVAKGKGLEIKRGQLDGEVIRRKAAYAAGRQPAPPGLEQQVLDELIASQLLMGKATEADRAAAKDDFQKSLKTFMESRKLTEEEFNQKLAPELRMQNLTREEWDKQRIDAALARIVLKRELKINVTDADVKKYYDDNPARFEKPEMVRASHILLTTKDPTTGVEMSEAKKAEKKKQMEDLLKRARAGEDFGKLAQEFSEDPGSKDKGGEYKFPRGQMVPEFEAAAFSLQTNQVSDIVTTAFGYHIIKLSEKMPAEKVELSKAAPDIKEGLTQQALQKGFADYIEKAKKEAGVEILDEKLKPKDTGELPGLPAGHPPVQPEKKPGAK